MPSTFTWLDYSEHERRAMLDIMKQFGERDTRDELGIGSVRDALADLLFPGTSTIQTRARYFLFIPWIYVALENRQTDPGKISDRVRRQETALISALLSAGETEGVIGRQAQDKLQRMPSNIYWQALGVLGLRTFRGSQDQYHRSLGAYYAQQAQLNRQRSEEPGDLRGRTNWHAALPIPPDNFPNEVTLALTRVEAEYLRERIQTQAPDSLLAFWVSRRKMPPTSTFPWDLIDENHPLHLREKLIHAQNFSEAMHGAALLYNLLLAEQAVRTDAIENYRTVLKDWTDGITARLDEFAKWDQAQFWGHILRINPRVPRLTRLFVERWLEVTLDPVRLPVLAEDGLARRMIRERELFLKRGQARLENRRALDLWNGAAGTGRLDFRWNVSQRHLQDIHDGLKNS